MKLGWDKHGNLAPARVASRFVRAAIGALEQRETKGALILLRTGAVTCGEGFRASTRNGTCLWLSRGDLRPCELTENATGFLVLVAFEPEHSFSLTSRIMLATPLLYAVIERLAEMEINGCPLRASYEDVAMEEVLRGLDAEEAAQLPRSAQLQLWALEFRDNPRVSFSIEEAAGATHMSVRSFTRHFKKETGEDFRTWKRRALLNKAKSLLYYGRTVSQVSSELAYENVTSFIAMFKEATGQTPGDYTKAPKTWSELASKTAVNKSEPSPRKTKKSGFLAE